MWGLPQALLARINSEFPKHHAPAQEDLKGRWAIRGEGEVLPFLATGDFNGDAMNDAALVLVSADEWRFAIFHQSDAEDYELAFSFGGNRGVEEALIVQPQEIILSSHRRGEPLHVDAGGQTLQYTFDSDVVIFTVDEKAMSVFYWQDGAYQSLDFMD